MKLVEVQAIPVRQGANGLRWEQAWWGPGATGRPVSRDA